ADEGGTDDYRVGGRWSLPAHGNPADRGHVPRSLPARAPRYARRRAARGRGRAVAKHGCPRPRDARRFALETHVSEMAERYATSFPADFATQQPSPAPRGAGRLINRRAVMRAIVREKFGGPENLVYKDIPEPEPEAGHVVIQIKAFGINHAEMHMRRGEW